MRCGSCSTPLPASEMAGGLCPRCALAGAIALGEASTKARRPSIEGYETLYELGRGAMGVVWLAHELALDRLVALKLIGPGANPQLGSRLLREGRAVAQLRHPNIVAIHALGETPDGTYLAMDFIEDGDLQARLKTQPPSPHEAAKLVAKLASALAHAHANGVLHRDVKPSNILLDATGEPRLADFGLAAPVGGAGDLTAPGQIAGTPAFLAPELFGGAGHASPRSDIYGLGAVLYACLTGRAPFVGENAAAIFTQMAANEPLPPRLLNPAVPRDLQTVCLACLAKDPAGRYASAAALHDDLQRFLSGEPVRAREVGALGKITRWCRRKPALAFATGLAAVLVLVLAVGGPVVAWRMAKAREAAEAAERKALAAEAQTREQLREALLARSQATRLSGWRGQRYDALAATERAAQIRPGIDARDEAIAALALPDVTLVREWPLRKSVRERVNFSPGHDRYVLLTEEGTLELRRLSDGALLRELKGVAKPTGRPTFSPDGHWLVLRDAPAQVVVWRDDASEPALVLRNVGT